MSTTSLFDAKPEDPAAEAQARIRNRMIAVAMAGLLVLTAIGYWNRNWPEEHVVDKFFTAIEKKDYETAYGIWRADPQWQQHTDQYKQYPFGQFQLDWGPSGDFGYITKHDVRGSVSPKSNNSATTGVIVAVRVNDRAKAACLWVEKSTKAISFSPRECNAN